MTAKLALVNGEVLQDTRFVTKAVIIEKNVVSNVVDNQDIPADCELHDITGKRLAPGYIDIQVNGGGGVLLNDIPSVETITKMSEAHRQYGTTHMLPTLISDDIDTIIQTITAVSEAIEAGVPGILGVHLEGPFLNPEKKGIHNDAKFIQLVDELVPVISQLTQGKTLITLAPECVESKIIQALCEAGCVVFAGHTNATYEQCLAAETAGLSGYTHLFNAMSAFQSRAPGVVGAALHSDSAYFGIIADGHHVHPASMSIAIQAKPERAILVSDAMPSVGSQIKTFSLGNEIIYVAEGRCTNEHGTLAGSHLNMQDAVKNVQQLCKVSKAQALKMASLHPARALGLDGTYGKIEQGFSASFVILDETDAVVGTYVDGTYFTP